MTSHGHGIARATRPRTEEERKLDLDKISRYRTLEDQVREKKSQNDFRSDTFQLTSKLLRLNPEYYTVWNVRRRCVISGFSSKPSLGSSPSKASSNSSPTVTQPPSSDAPLPPSSAETQQSHDSRTVGKNGTTADPAKADAEKATSDAWKTDLEAIKAELMFTIPLLKEFPKCYWIWNYRLWLLNQAIERLPLQVARQVWKEELGLIGKMLNLDQRNFHAWGYRRYVTDKLESAELAGSSLVESEFEFTTKKIEANLSNFSAWHYRSQLIPRMLREREADDASRRKFLDSELDYIRDGLNVGPEDQSLWFYHQFLISNITDPPGTETIAPALTAEEKVSYIQREIEEMIDLLEDYEDVKWIYEALIQYSITLAQLGRQGAKLKPSNDIVIWLRKLRELDPQRSGRWTDLEAQVNAI